MIINNASVFCIDKRFETQDIYINDTRFVDKDCYIDDGKILDGANLIALPGFIDVHTHGCLGCDYTTATSDQLRKMLNYQISNAVTSLCATTMTLDCADIKACCKTLAKYSKANSNTRSCDIIGINLEGPFLASEKKGAHDSKFIINPSKAILNQMMQASEGLCKLITIAPEKSGAMDFIAQCSEDIHISIGHTNADYETAKKAFKLGANHITHMYNAMNGIHHRDPGVILAGMDSSNVYSELICDGVHVHPAVIRASFKMFSGRIVAVSDSMPATGLADGNYTLGGQSVIVKNGVAQLIDGTIAGSTSNLYESFKYMVKTAKIPLWEAVESVTINPARSIGILDKIGSIDKNKRADLVLLDKDLQIRYVLKGGEFASVVCT